MPANTSPIFPLTPNCPVGKKVGIAANVKSDGTGAQIGNGGTAGDDMILVFTAGSNGSFVESVKFSPSGSTAATATAATVLRVYQSSQTTGATTAGNTTLLAEVQAAAQTADQTTTATFAFEVPLNKKIPSGQTILVSSHIVNNANTNWCVICYGGDY